MLKLRFTQRATDDLSRLRAFIAKDNSQAAQRLSWALRGSIQRLVDQSRMGQALGTPDGVRRWVTGPYVVHYTIEGQSLTVLRVWHGREQRPEGL